MCVLAEGDSTALAEQKYVKRIPYDTGIGFTNFTSCIGVVVKNEDGLSGVHLVVCCKDDKYIYEQAGIEDQIIEALGEHTNSLIFGHIGSVWSNSQNEELARFTESLRRRCGNLTEMDLKDGAYKVTFKSESGEFEVTQI